MTKPKDPTVKAVEKNDVKSILDQVAYPSLVSPEAKRKLQREPEISKPYLEAKAREYDLPVERVSEIAQTVAQETGPPLVLEKREISVGADVKEDFRRLFQKEIERRQTCDFLIEVSYFSPAGKQSSTHRLCGERLETVQEFWAHQAMHIARDCNDPRTQRAMLMDMRELLWPTQEKSVRAAFGPEERLEMQTSLERQRARVRARE